MGDENVVVDQESTEQVADTEPIQETQDSNAEGNQPEASSSDATETKEAADNVVGGDGDIFNLKNFGEDATPEQIHAAFTKAFNESRQKDKGFANFKTEEEFNAAMAQKIQQLQEHQQKITEADSNEAWIAQNWDTMTDVEKQSAWQNLSEEQQNNVANTVAINRERGKYQSLVKEQNDKANVEKYGDTYKEMLPELDSKYQEQFNKNPYGVAFRSMNYEAYGKEQRELGRKEALKGLSNSAALSGNTVNENISKVNRSAEDVMKQAMKDNGLL